MVEVTDATFDAEVLRADKPVLVAFFASWCPHCQALAPIVDQFADDRNDIKVATIDIDANPDACTALNVGPVPALFVFRKGHPVGDPSVGEVSRAELESWVDDCRHL